MKRITRDLIFVSLPLSHDLARKSVQGGVTTLTAQGVQFILQLAGTVILARLLTPNDYGLIGMVMIVVNFAAMFKDAGLSTATVQKETISHEQISTLFWLNIAIIAFLGLCGLGGSPLVASFYGRRELTAVTAALWVSFIISGLVIQHQALLRRHIRFGELACIQITSQVANIGLAIVLACIGWRYWALVGGAVAQAVSSTLLTFWFCPWVPGWIKKKSGVRHMVKFGGHLTGFNLANYFARNADNILIGRYIGADALGLYARAYQVFMLPISQIRNPLNQVALPVLSSLRNQPDRYVKYYQRLLDMVATLATPLTIYCALEADFLVRVLLGPNWTGAVLVFRILAIAGFMQAIAGTRGLVLLSCGFSRRYFYWGLFNAILCVASFIIGLPFGIEGVAGAYTVVNYLILIPSLFYCFSETPVTTSLFLRTLIAPLLASVLAASGAILARWAWGSDTITAHASYAGVFVIIYVGLSLCRLSVRETLKLAIDALPLMSRVRINTP